MSVSREYITFLLDQLASLGAVETRRMFGCVALFQAGRMFALVDGDAQLYIKADDKNRESLSPKASRLLPMSLPDAAAASRKSRWVITASRRSWWRIIRNYCAGRAREWPLPCARRSQNRVKPP